MMLTAQAMDWGLEAEASEDCGLVPADVDSFLPNFRNPWLTSPASKKSKCSTPEGVYF